MKAVVYSTKLFEKEYLAKANQKKHDITLISNPLSIDTVGFAEGKEVVIVFTNDDVSAKVIERLKQFGIKYIATRSVGTDHIDRNAASEAGMKIANVPAYSPQSIAEHAVALMLSLNRQIVKAHQNSSNFDFRLDDLQGFTLYNKTVGLYGYGKIADSLAKILKGFGCQVICTDPFITTTPHYVKQVSFDELLKQSDIISLHAPLTDQTKYIINKTRLAAMKDGVMLINTSRGALINTLDLIDALQIGKVAYFGGDVYENEKGLFFEDHRSDRLKDPILQELMAFENVIITPHQAFLTKEALQEIANKTISNLDKWQAGKCVGTACACAKTCQVAQSSI